jgi:hypothetical protein
MRQKLFHGAFMRSRPFYLRRNRANVDWRERKDKRRQNKDRELEKIYVERRDAREKKER